MAHRARRKKGNEIFIGIKFFSEIGGSEQIQDCKKKEDGRQEVYQEINDMITKYLIFAKIPVN